MGDEIDTLRSWLEGKDKYIVQLEEQLHGFQEEQCTTHYQEGPCAVQHQEEQYAAQHEKEQWEQEDNGQGNWNHQHSGQGGNPAQYIP